MRKMMMKKSKKGITLVESVFAVVILATLTIGVISLLTAGGVKIFEISSEADAYSQAVQKLDMVISAISNGSDDYITTDPVVSLDVDALKTTLGIKAEELDKGIVIAIAATPELYNNDAEATVSNFRGWYITVTMTYADPQNQDNGGIGTVTVKGFVSNSGGVFDR